MSEEKHSRLSPAEAAKIAAKYAANLSVQFNDKTLSTIAKFIGRQQTENQELRKEVEALKKIVAEGNAAADAHLGTVKKLLQRAEQRVADDKSVSTSLSAVVRGDIREAARLLERGPANPVQEKQAKDSVQKSNAAPVPSQESPAARRLGVAIHAGDIEQVKSLIAQGADINVGDSLGVTPLMQAALYGRAEIARVLVDHGVNLDVKDNFGETALDYAINYMEVYRSTEIFELLQKSLASLPTTSAPSAKPQGLPFTVLIDGSNSMGHSRNFSPLVRSLAATTRISKIGANASAVVWKKDAIVPVAANGENFEKILNSLTYCNDFTPVLDYMNKAPGQHFAIVSDGDFIADGKLSAKISDFLVANPKVTLDIVLVTDSKADGIVKLAATLSHKHRVRASLRVVQGKESLKSALTSIASERNIYPPQAKRGAVQKAHPEWFNKP